uniref:BRO1 domain-containing protein n=1 Tax=Syphacia muris TaxID=451379 RepID=A0A0N5AMA9_9BILA
MSAATFLAVPLKTTVEVDLVKPLTSYIESMYQNAAKNDNSEIKQAVIELNKLRNRTCMQPLDKHQNALDVLTRYYDQLVAIENKLPITATQNPISFKWRDAFDKGSLFSSRASLTLSDGAFERAAVLFNCGALMSAIAACQPMNTDEEMKVAAKYFQQSSGVFAHLRDTVLGLVHQEPTPDLLPDSLSALSAVMLAQAQEAIYIKAARDKMKSSALVKLSSQCAEYYREAQKLLHRENVRGVFEKDWLNTVTGKSLAMSALAQFHQSEACGDSREIGEQLSRLGQAVTLMQQANGYLHSSAFAKDTAEIQKTYQTAKKDNDFIYHERVVDFASLPALPKAAVAKALPVQSPMTPRFKDMFSSLVPVQVHQALATYESRKADLINMETGRLREHTQIMNGILASLNLPAALDDATNQEALPESIKQKSAKVKQLGGINALNTLFNDLPNLLKRNQEIINETLRMLNEEQDSDNSLRSQFKEKWTRMASEKLTGPLYQEVGKYTGILNSAKSADQIVKGKLEQNRKAIELLSDTEPELRQAISLNCLVHVVLLLLKLNSEVMKLIISNYYIFVFINFDFSAAIPGLDPSSVISNSEAVRKLRDLMNLVQSIKVEREKLESSFATVQFDMSNTFLKAMGDGNTFNEEQISGSKLNELYGPLREKVNESITQQEKCLAEVELWNKKFCTEKSSTTNAAERENMLKMLANGHDKFIEIKSNLDEGTKATFFFFYNDMTPLLVRLQQKVSDFCFARKTEKEDLMKQLQQNIVSGGGNSSSTNAPPPRPPPPKTQPSTNPFDVEAPIAPPQNVNSLHGIVFIPAVQFEQKLIFYTESVNQLPNIPNAGSFQPQPPFYPYGQPMPYACQGQVPYMPNPQFQQNYTTPYPIAYPGTYPGAFNLPQGYGQFPPQPQQPQP